MSAIDDELKNTASGRILRARGVAPSTVNVGLLAALGAVPSPYAAQKKKFNKELRHGQRHQDFRVAGFGKRATERYTRQQAKAKERNADDIS